MMDKGYTLFGEMKTKINGKNFTIVYIFEDNTNRIHYAEKIYIHIKQ